MNPTDIPSPCSVELHAPAMETFQGGVYRRHFTSYLTPQVGEAAPPATFNFTTFLQGPSSFRHLHPPGTVSISLTTFSNTPSRANTMAYDGSFFEDGFFDARAPTLVDPLMQPLCMERRSSSAAGFQPLLPSNDASPPRTLPLSGVDKVESVSPVTTPGILNTHVNASEYSQVSYDEVMRASVDYDAMSPTSADTLSEGPVTPRSSSGETFSEHFLQSGQHMGNAVAKACLLKARVNHTSNMFQPYLATVPPLSTSEATSPASLGTRSLAPTTGNTHHNWPSASPRMAWPQTEQAAPSLTSPTYAFGSISTEPSNAVSASWPSHEPQHCTASDSVTAASESEETQPSRSHSPNNPALTREELDEFIVTERNRGTSYKEIKRRAGIRGAESTLRGRYRVLTKSRELRVRKPMWTKKDVKLLRAEVELCRKDPGYLKKPKSLRHIPWKKVGEQIVEKGASYPFGPSTCARKWEEVMRKK